MMRDPEFGEDRRIEEEDDEDLVEENYDAMGNESDEGSEEGAYGEALGAEEARALYASEDLVLEDGSSRRETRSRRSRSTFTKSDAASRASS